jgi:hypothetical protein
MSDILDHKSSAIVSVTTESKNPTYKIVFKDGLYTNLSYKILKRFELIKTIMDEYNNKTIELPTIDINVFMSLLDEMLDRSIYNTLEIKYALLEPERILYNYLITEPVINNVINKFVKEIMEILDIYFENYNYNYNYEENNPKEDFHSLRTSQFMKLSNKYPILSEIDKDLKIMDVKVNVGNSEFEFDIRYLLKQLRYNFEKYNNHFGYSEIITHEFSTVYVGFYKPMNCDIIVFMIDNNYRLDPVDIIEYSKLSIIIERLY